MTTILQHWLTEQRSELLARWHALIAVPALVALPDMEETPPSVTSKTSCSTCCTTQW